MSTPPATDAARFATVLERVARSLSRVDRQEVCCAGYTRQQFETLRLLSAGGPLATGALAAHLRIDLSTASRNLALLERDGCLARRRGAADRRAVLNELTAKGRRCVTALGGDERAAFGAVLRAIAPARRASVTASLALLAGALESLDEAGCCAPAAAPGAPARG